MNKILFLLVFFTACGSSTIENNKNIDVIRLVKITENSDLNEFKKYVHELSYEITDSSQLSANSFIFYSREKKLGGNVLSCSYNTQSNTIDILTFSTNDKGIYEDVVSQIKKLNFKSSGKGKGGFDDIIETDEFEKENIIIPVAIRDRQGRPREYEFTFLKL